MRIHFQPLKSVRPVHIFLGGAVLGILLVSGAVFLQAHPKETSGRLVPPGGINPYFVGVCSGSGETCDPNSPPSGCGDCRTGQCTSNPNFLCDPYVCRDTTTGTVYNGQGGQPLITCGGTKDAISCGSGATCIANTYSPSGCGSCTPIVSDLDNCPGGPNARACFDPDFPGVQVSCGNPDQADSDLDLYGDICDGCGNGTCSDGESFCSCPVDCPRVEGQVCCAGGPVTGDCCSDSQCADLKPWDSAGVTGIDFTYLCIGGSNDGQRCQTSSSCGGGTCTAYFRVYSKDRVWSHNSTDGYWDESQSGFILDLVRNELSSIPEVDGQYPWEGEGITGVVQNASELTLYSKDKYWVIDGAWLTGEWVRSGKIEELSSWQGAGTIDGQLPWEGEGITAIDRSDPEGVTRVFSKDRMWVFDFDTGWDASKKGLLSTLWASPPALVVGGQKPWGGAGVTGAMSLYSGGRCYNSVSGTYGVSCTEDSECSSGLTCASTGGCSLSGDACRTNDDCRQDGVYLGQLCSFNLLYLFSQNRVYTLDTLYKLCDYQEAIISCQTKADCAGLAGDVECVSGFWLPHISTDVLGFWGLPGNEIPGVAGQCLNDSCASQYASAYAWDIYYSCVPGYSNLRIASDIIREAAGTDLSLIESVDQLQCARYDGSGGSFIVGCPSGSYDYCVRNQNDGAGNSVIFGINE